MTGLSEERELDKGRYQEARQRQSAPSYHFSCLLLHCEVLVVQGELGALGLHIEREADTAVSGIIARVTTAAVLAPYLMLDIRTSSRSFLSGMRRTSLSRVTTTCRLQRSKYTKREPDGNCSGFSERCTW